MSGFDQERAPLVDRRQSAREAFDDEWNITPGQIDREPWAIRLQIAREASIETATRVQITPEIIEAARDAWRQAEGSWADDPGPREAARLAAAFRAAGFEVVD